MQYITITDFFILPFVLLFIYLISKFLRNKNYSDANPVKRYFVPGIMVKVLGAVSFGLIYQYYYGFGDTFGFYATGQFFSDIIDRNSEEFMKVYFTGDREYFRDQSYAFNFSSWYGFNPATVTVARFSSFIGNIVFGNFLLISICFSLLSFSGLWKFFRMFVTIYPTLAKPFAWFILYLPSVIFWGSGILKDTLTIGALGWLCYSSWKLFIVRKNFFISLLTLILSVLALISLKPYILLSFLPSFFIWLSFEYRSRIKVKALRAMMVPVLLAVMTVSFMYISTLIANEFSELALENIANSAIRTQTNIQAYEAGSTYNIGEVSPGLFGLLQKAPLAFATTMYRPFVWEISSFIMLFSAFESLLMLSFTLWIFYKVGVSNFFKHLFGKPIVFFCFSFSLIFAIAVAISAGNFGTLVRYKIPCLPYYLIAMTLIYFYSEKPLPSFMQPKQKVIRKRRGQVVRTLS